MAKTPSPAAAKAPMIAPHRLEPEAAIDARRAAPASLMSVTFHIVLVALFAILAPATIMVGGATEKGRAGHRNEPADEQEDGQVQRHGRESRRRRRRANEINYDNRAEDATSASPASRIPPSSSACGTARNAPPTNDPARRRLRHEGRQGAPSEAAIGNTENAVGTRRRLQRALGRSSLARSTAAAADRERRRSQPASPRRTPRQPSRAGCAG